jgi:hypothetical protein
VNAHQLIQPRGSAGKSRHRVSQRTEDDYRMIPFRYNLGSRVVRQTTSRTIAPLTIRFVGET